jgi:hypothetical protein
MSPEALELENKLRATARQVFDIIPSYFDEREAQAVAAEIAKLILRSSSLVERSPEVRQMLESYAALDTFCADREK